MQTSFELQYNHAHASLKSLCVVFRSWVGTGGSVARSGLSQVVTWLTYMYWRCIESSESIHSQHRKWVWPRWIHVRTVTSPTSLPLTALTSHTAQHDNPKIQVVLNDGTKEYDHNGWGQVHTRVCVGVCVHAAGLLQFYNNYTVRKSYLTAEALMWRHWRGCGQKCWPHGKLL